MLADLYSDGDISRQAARLASNRQESARLPFPDFTNELG